MSASEADVVPKPKRKTAPCPCGSGKQWRYCHGATEKSEPEPELAVRRNPRQLFVWIVLIGAPLAWAAGFLMPSRNGTTGAGTVRVWSEEHGHYHTVDADQAKAQKADAAAKAASGDAAGAPVASDGNPAPAAPEVAKKPEGPAPPGKVWSEAHGHWHNVDGSQGGKELPQYDPSDGMPWNHDYKLERPDEERDGFTWSEAHGHWHPSAGQ